MGDWFLFYMLGQNVDSIIFKEKTSIDTESNALFKSQKDQSFVESHIFTHKKTHWPATVAEHVAHPLILTY